MITAKMATWLLIVRLQDPLSTSAHQVFDMNYEYPTPQTCEAKARDEWTRLYQYYPDEGNMYRRAFSTICRADSSNTRWTWVITCNRNMLCKRVETSNPI